MQIIGLGSYGVVLLARNRHTGEKFAIKELPKTAKYGIVSCLMRLEYLPKAMRHA
jgi:serine/threonine protein kinase